MAIQTGPTIASFLKTVKAFILAEYAGNLGTNRHFQLNIASNEVGDILVQYHVCDPDSSDDDVPIEKLIFNFPDEKDMSAKASEDLEQVQNKRALETYIDERKCEIGL